ncbi:MAG TPA: class II D-tagatose-bisphosphate aldolase, non-catalytic subunit [Anaerolineales bacterium]|nr:class II D-tagatose-bisphosphate aldolase, non-catalytic subunit [Anaerolineales bacterium]
MYLDEIVAAQKRGEARGITSVCSAHPAVIQQTLRVFAEHPRNEAEGIKTLRVSPLIEATCNQVNQFGGYTGMTPTKFVDYVRGIAEENEFPFENIILGGDHLGPSVWQNEPANVAMQKAEVLVREYVQAGFTKIHLDCSMRLADDSPGALDVEDSARRAAQLAKVAERTIHSQQLRYVIGTEVPIPGGAIGQEETVRVTKVEEARQTIEVTRAAFLREGLADAWEKVVGLVVQPGVEFGDEMTHTYQPEAARELSKFIESQPIIYEAHSTDYQTHQALKELVRDHFAILKVGPALTFAYREAIFALAMIENELMPEEKRSNIVQVLEQTMLKHPEHWRKYYAGDEAMQAHKRKYSLSDRIRYYWARPEVEHSLKRLMQNLDNMALPNSLLSGYVGQTNLTASQVIEHKINLVLRDYLIACGHARV